MEKLPKAFKKKWLEALRSGKYKQGFGKLESLNNGKPTYCCLGVACKILYPNEKLLGGIIDDGAYIKVPNILRGGSTENDIVCELTEMNDGTTEDDKPKTFKQIADWIENNL